MTRRRTARTAPGQRVDSAQNSTDNKPASFGEDLTQIALTALRAVAADSTAPAAARAQAARTLLEAAGAIGRHAKPPGEDERKPLSTLSQAELLAELERLRGETQQLPW